MKRKKIISITAIGACSLSILCLAGFASTTVYSETSGVKMAQVESNQRDYHNERILAKTVDNSEWDLDMGEALLPPEE